MKQNANVHGIVSLLLTFDAVAVALISIGQQSILMAGTYLLLFILALIIIAVMYCTKCLCRNNCNHLIIGWLSTKLSKPKPGKYNTKDWVLGVVLPYSPVIVIPQFYLYQNFFYLVLFWFLLGISVIEVNFYVCRGCKNTKCAMCKTKQLGSVMK